VLVKSELLYQVKAGEPYFDGKLGRWEDLEGWYVVAPGNVRDYLVWRAKEKAREDREDVPE